MSWSFSGTSDGKSIDEVLRAAGKEFFDTYNPSDEGMKDAAEDAGEVAIQAVVGILESGVLGNLEKTYWVNLSGHANPNNEPSGNWTNDCVTISISQR